MTNPPGYPLPSGELGDDEIVCQLVYLPDRPEYWQAFLGALSYMATWRAWERDDDKRGKDAAANWREAFELTMECWRMTCLEQLQDDVAAILAIMQIPQACCDAGDVTDGDQYTDRVEDGVGNVPQNIIDAGYASGTSDWDGFDDYKCMISHVIVDQLVLKLNEIAPLVDTAGGVLGGVAAIAGILAVIFGTGGLAIVFGIVAGIGATSLLYQAIADFGLVESLATKVTTNHDELVCSVMYGDGDEDALDSLNDKIDELFTAAEALVLKNMNLGPTLKALYAGRYDQQDIADILLDAGYDLLDFTCDCQQVGEYLEFFDFEDEDWDEWLHTGYVIRTGNGIDDWCVDAFLSTSESFFVSTAAIRAMVGLPPTAGKVTTIHRVSFWYRFDGANGGDARLIVYNDSTTFDDTYTHTETWTFVEEIFDPPLEATHPTPTFIQFLVTGGPSGRVMFDNITLDFDSET